MLVYFAADTDEHIDVTNIFDDRKETKVFGAWFNPADGKLTAPEELIPTVNEDKKTILHIRNSSTDGKDRVLILADDPAEICVPNGCYGIEVDKQEAVKVFEW